MDDLVGTQHWDKEVYFIVVIFIFITWSCHRVGWKREGGAEADRGTLMGSGSLPWSSSLPLTGWYVPRQFK